MKCETEYLVFTLKIYLHFLIEAAPPSFRLSQNPQLDYTTKKKNKDKPPTRLYNEKEAEFTTS